MLKMFLIELKNRTSFFWHRFQNLKDWIDTLRATGLENGKF